MALLRHACNHPGCPEIVEAGKRFCKKHSRELDRQRGTATERGYNWRWQQASRAFLREHPLCECKECRALGRIIPSEVTDHRIPHRGDPVLFWDRSNWQAMSKTCHDRKTATEDSNWGRQ